MANSADPDQLASSEEKKKTKSKNKIIFLPIYPNFQKHVIGTTSIICFSLVFLL